jgi:sigma-54 dependent transcriptional regulator, acetoin dehydrogenase operon transcriptional activator AcoR
VSDLLAYQKNLQAITELVKYTQGVDVFVVDDGMVAIAGTGSYRTNIGTRRPHDSYVDVTITRGDGQTVINPRDTHQCNRCEYRRLCPYAMVICRPLVNKDRIKGLIGFLSFSENQRRNMITRSSLLCEISERLGYFWETADLDQHLFLRHPGTTEFIDFFEEGLILTTPDYDVINLNQRVEHLLGLKRNSSGKKDLSRIIKEDLRVGRFGRSDSGILKAYRRRDYPLTGSDGISSHVLVISDETDSHKNWQGCVLTSPVFSMIVGTSDAIIRLRERAANVARNNSTVLITGETGVGKELVARYIHHGSRRWAEAFETVNCAAIPDSLFESEFFGYAPGAFTGAAGKGKTGLFPAAHGGTIFLDEVGRLSLSNQAKVLRILEDGLVRRLGEKKKRQVDVRIVSASNIDLKRAVEEGRFIPDLYYRLAVVPLKVPPLRERIRDIPLLVEHFGGMLKSFLPESDFHGFSNEVMAHFAEYGWPGNVRELKNLVEYAMNMVRHRKVEMKDIAFQGHTASPRRKSISAVRGEHFELDPNSLPATATPLLSLKELEKRQVLLALETYGNHTEGKRRAARHLGISLSTLYRKMGKMGYSDEG